MTSKIQVIRTDERVEAVRALEMTRIMLIKVQHDVYYWKWVVIALHNSLQNFMVAAISGADGLGALTDKSVREWKEAYDTNAKEYPEPKLAEFLELYKRMKKQCGFNPASDVNSSIKSLHKEFRNNFNHFTPKGWSIIVNGFPKIAVDCLAAIKCAGWESGRLIWYEDDMLQEAQVLYEGCMEILTGLHREYTENDYE